MSETQTVTQIAAMTFVDTVSEDFRLGHCCLSSLALMKPEAVGQQLIQGTDNVVPTGCKMPELAAEKLT